MYINLFNFEDENYNISFFSNLKELKILREFFKKLK